jgi:predicted kinase/endonuclease/exonuclease/phosphatase family metal-dependent hydrolase
MQTIVGAAEMKSTADDEPASSCRLKVLTWNVNSDEVDGGTPLRLKAIISEIKTSVADVIFLQEVSLNFKTMLQQQFGHAYDFEDCSSHAKEPFFVMIMLRRCRMTVLSSKRIDFQGGGQSNMGRHILLVETQLAGWNTNIILMTAHLESCKENSEIRVLQYEQLLRLIVQAPAACVQICGGDFNLREAEDKKARKRLKDAGIDVGLVVDTYDAAGRPFEASCTWRRKMDKTADARSIQARFDRQMFRSGSADFKLAAEDGVTLLGLQDVAGIDGETACRAGFSTPSDHFGIFCEYILGDELQTVSKSATSGGLRSAVDRSASLESPIVIVLIGAPGSGKSTLAALLSPAFDRINQDALGCRSKCEDCAKAALQNGRSIVIDRCNFDAQQRSTWLSIARNFAARAVAVQLDVPLSVCTQRVAARRGHEGGVEGDSLAITDVVAKLHGDQRPVADDEGFNQVRVFQHTSTPENTAMELLSTFGMQSASHSRVSTVPSSRPNPLPLRVPRVIGAQCDSSDSDSSQERRAIAFSLSSEHLSAAVPAATPAPAPASSHLQAFWSCQGCTFHNTDMERHNCSMCDSIRNTVAVPLPAAPAPASAPATAALMNKVGASDDDCILVQHDPPRYVFPLQLYFGTLMRSQQQASASRRTCRGITGIGMLGIPCAVYACDRCSAAYQGEEGSRYSVRT